MVGAHDWAIKRSQVQIATRKIFQSALAAVGFVGTWGGIPGRIETGEVFQVGHTNEN
jgi:hypothetical protein